MNPFQFLPKDPVIWRGHYERIPGDTTTFHCDINGKVFVRWDDLETGDQLTSKGLEFGDVGELGEAVNEIKFQFNGKGGGSFLINEFGNVIVPTSDGHVRYHVGDVEGHIYFKDPDSNRFFTLDSTSEHQRGDLWERPYVGNMYHQSPDGRIFRNLEYDDVIEKQYLNGDPNIAEDLVAVRGTNGYRFIVICHGVVLTKVEGRNDWEPRYVGKIDFQEWFEDGL